MPASGALSIAAANEADAQATANRLMLTSGGGCKLVHTAPNTMRAWYGEVWAENIACAPNSPQWACADVAQFHDLFMGSPTHRADILNGSYAARRGRCRLWRVVHLRGGPLLPVGRRNTVLRDDGSPPLR